MLIETTYLPGGVHIWHNNWLLCVDYNKGLRSDNRCDVEVEGQSQIYLKVVSEYDQDIPQS